MVWEFIQAFTTIRTKQHFHADDGTDKLNRSTTVIFLIIATLLVGARQFVGTSIVCLNDHTITTSYATSYIESVCWAKNTYRLTDYKDKSTAVQVTYYQWLPFILLCVALCYYIPYLIWKSLLKSTCALDQIPIDVSGVVNTLKESKLYKQKEFNSTMKEVVDYLNNCFICNSFEYRHAIRTGSILDYDYDTNNGRLNLIKLNDQYQKLSRTESSKSRTCCLASTMRPTCLGLSIIFKYLFVKVIYIAISISMFWFIDLFLNLHDGFYGFGMINRMFIKQDLTHAELWNSIRFPRIVYCDLNLRNDPLHVHDNTFQCSLPINIFNEKIFMFFWFWFLILAILNCLSFVRWIYLIVTRKRLIKRYLNPSQSSITNPSAANTSFFGFDRNESRLVNLFIKNYLQYDGLFALLIIKSNLNDIHFKRLIDYLWKIYSISNLDDHDLMQPTPPRHTSTTNKHNSLNLTSPVVVPQQPSAIVAKNGQRKFLFNNNDDDLSTSKIKLIDGDEKSGAVNDDSDYFNNETQQRPRVPAQDQQQQQKGTSYIGFRKEELV